MKLSLGAASILALVLSSGAASADECVPPPGGKCLTKEQLDQVKEALRELKSIHEAPAALELTEPIIIVHDWEGRVYVNGGDAKPLKMKLKLGDTIDRDLAATLPTQVYYRPKPPDPMFRLRIRAQAGLLVPQLVNSIDGTAQRFWDAGIGWDFFHYDALNVSLYTGVNSSGGGIGYDITKNFGPYVGYSLVYDGFKSSVLTGIYFSFN